MEYKSYLLSYVTVDATVRMNGHVTHAFGRVVWPEIFYEMPEWTRIVLICKQKHTSVNVALHLRGLGRFHSRVSHISECNRCKLVAVIDLTRRCAGPREL